MKILIVSYYFHPEITPRSFRTTELAKELSRKGNMVKVLTKKTVFKEQQKLADDENLELAFFNRGPRDLRFKNTSGIYGKLAIVMNRFLVQFLDHPNFGIKGIVASELKSELFKNNYDLIISIAHPHAVHWGVADVVRKKRKKSFTWIADCGDPYMKAQNLNYKRPFYFWFWEKMFCKNADYISVPFEGARKGYLSRYSEKIAVIPQGFSFDEVERIKKPPFSINKLVRVGYAGSLVLGRRDPTELVNLLDLEGINYELHIYTNKKHLLKNLADKAKGKVIMYDYIDRLLLLERLCELDFVINFQNKGLNQLPSKLIDYSLIDKPILNIEYGNLNKNIVLEFTRGDYSNEFKVEGLERYNIVSVAQQFIDLS
jgi:hypothetical protein